MGNRTVTGRCRRKRIFTRNIKCIGDFWSNAEGEARCPKEPENGPIGGENAYRYAVRDRTLQIDAGSYLN
jgi:hypothetical protein